MRINIEIEIARDKRSPLSSVMDLAPMLLNIYSALMHRQNKPCECDEHDEGDDVRKPDASSST